MLKIQQRQFYQVQAGQTLQEIAEAFCISPFKLAEVNNISEPIKTGRILYIPNEKGDAYIVKAGEDKRLLCGSEERYLSLNGTSVLYPGMKIRI